jgi:hypothetical protein
MPTINRGKGGGSGGSTPPPITNFSPKTSPTITYAGLPYPDMHVPEQVTNPILISVGADNYGGSGLWVDRLTMTNATNTSAQVTSITSTDLTGISGSGGFDIVFGVPAGTDTHRLSSVSFPALEVINGTFNLQSITALTTVDFSALKYVGSSATASTALLFASFPAFNFTNLKHIGLSSAFAIENSNTTTIGFPALVSVLQGFTMRKGLYTLPLLKYVGGNLAFTNSATHTTTPSLQVVVGSYQYTSTTDTNINIATPKIGATLIITAAATGLTTVTTNGLVTLSEFKMGTGVMLSLSVSAPNLTSFTLGSSVKNIGANVAVTGNKLTQASVDSILASLVALDGTNGTTLYTGAKSVALTGGTNATPSSAGLASKATLVARGITVTHN